MDGFVLKSAFIHLEEQDGSESIHRRIMQFDENPHLDPDADPAGTAASRKLLQLELPSFDAQTNSRDRVLTLAKLNLLAYDRLTLGAKSARPGDADGVLSTSCYTPLLQACNLRSRSHGRWVWQEIMRKTCMILLHSSIS